MLENEDDMFDFGDACQKQKNTGVKKNLEIDPVRANNESVANTFIEGYFASVEAANKLKNK